MKTTYFLLIAVVLSLSVKAQEAKKQLQLLQSTLNQLLILSDTGCSWVTRL